MAYLDQSRRPSPGSMVAVIAVHAAIGAALIAGLTVSGVIKDKPGIVDTWDIPKDIPPPPPEPTPPAEPAQPRQSQPTHVPIPQLPLRPAQPDRPTTDLILPPIPTPQPGLRPAPDPGPSAVPQPRFAAVGAKPRNDPGRWLTDADYKSSWARQELVGQAQFRLEIAADGRVTNCTITGSTGHRELDNATCSLVTRRARFEPARGTEGEPVTGSYSSSVRWRLPE